MENVIAVDDVKRIAAAYETAMARAVLHKEDAQAAVDTAKALGIDPAAFKLGIKLKALAQRKPGKVRSFLKSLDEMVQGLDLDAQLDLEDAIKAAGTRFDGTARTPLDAERLAGELVANATRVVREDPDLARKLANSSLTDSEGNGFAVDADGVVTPIERPVEYRGPSAEEEAESLKAVEQRLKAERDAFKPRRGRPRRHAA